MEAYDKTVFWCGFDASSWGFSKRGERSDFAMAEFVEEERRDFGGDETMAMASFDSVNELSFSYV